MSICTSQSIGAFLILKLYLQFLNLNSVQRGQLTDRKLLSFLLALLGWFNQQLIAKKKSKISENTHNWYVKLIGTFLLLNWNFHFCDSENVTDRRGLEEKCHFQKLFLKL
uniref:Uncharacterized protein n=1 Tax=Glossina pallidipes TaxID=7398 RepID=A0A1A9ZDP9_GLOPL